MALNSANGVNNDFFEEEDFLSISFGANTDRLGGRPVSHRPVVINSSRHSVAATPVRPVSMIDSSREETLILLHELAKLVNVNLNYSLLKHIFNLIRIGVPPDDIYLFLKDCASKVNGR